MLQTYYCIFKVLMDNTKNNVDKEVLFLKAKLEKLEKENTTLRTKLDRILLLLQDTTIGVYQSTPDGTITRASGPLLKMLGFDSREDIQQHNLENHELISKEDRNIFKRIIESENIIIGHETQWLKKDGQPIYVRESARAIRDENNNIIFYEGTVEDISARKIKEIQLIESEQKYRTLVELLPNGIAIHKDYKIIYANDTLVKGLKLNNPESLLGRNIFEFCRRDYKQIIIDRLHTSLTNKSVAEVTEEIFISEKGDEMNAEVCTVPFEMNGSTHFMTIITNITERKLVEKEIKLSEITYRGMLNSISEAVFIQNIDGEFVDVNKAAEVVFGYEHNSFIGKTQNFLSNSLKNNQEKISDQIIKAYNGQPQFFRFWGVKSTGENFPTEVSLVPGLYFGKKVVIAVLRDITERLKSENLLRQSELKYKELIDFAVGGILLGNREGLIYEANSHMCELFGRKKNDVVGKKLYEGFFTENSLQNKPLDYDSLMKGNVIITEREILKPDGTTVPIEMHTKMMPDKSYQSIYHNISERKLAEKQILESKEIAEKLNLNKEALLKAMPDMIFTFDHEGQIIDFYSSSNNILLADPDYFINKNIVQVLPPELAEKTHNLIKHVLQTENMTQYTYNFERNNKTSYFDAKMVYVNSNTVLTVVRDVTERMELISDLEIAKIKAEESDKLKSAFLANMSHEIRTPMNAILGFTDLLKDNVTKAEKIEYLEIIENSCNQLLIILEDIIEISKIEAGIVTKRIESIDINILLQNLLSEMQGIIPKNRNIEMFMSKDMPNDNLILITDITKLKQILANLIVNAIKFTEAGHIEIGYKILKDEKIEIRVKDSGLGISPENLDKIFNRFVQITNKLSTFNSGSGLGLSICKAYSEMLGGKIWAESIEGTGSSFYLVIPINSENKN